jgi:hypothetical protein
MGTRDGMLPNYKDIIDLVKKGSTLEAQEKIMELREAAISQQEENIELRQRVKALEEQLALRAKVLWEAPYYWTEEDQKRDGPFCQSCYDKDGLIRLQKLSAEFGCLVCDKTVRDRITNHHRLTELGDWRAYNERVLVPILVQIP